MGNNKNIFQIYFQIPIPPPKTCPSSSQSPFWSPFLASPAQETTTFTSLSSVTVTMVQAPDSSNSVKMVVALSKVLIVCLMMVLSLLLTQLLPALATPSLILPSTTTFPP